MLPNFYKRNKLVFILFGLIVFIVFVGVSLKERATSTAEAFAGDTVAAGQRIVSYPAMFVTSNFSNVIHMWDANEENKKLKQKIKGFEQVEADNYRLDKENQELRHALKTESISIYEPEISTVISRNHDQWMNTMIINKGKSSGFKENMAVITTEGLVGRLKKVNSYSSQVEMITSNVKASKISVTLQQGDEEIFGMVDHFDDKKNLLVISDIDNNVKVKVGTRVVTSGLGGQFPKGILIGKVKKVENDEYGLSQIAYVETSADLKGLSQVYIAKKSPKAVTLEGSGE
ncbi:MULTISPECIES: rod shape-determining protein MreC [Staphylococcaceae]|uniref:Cell shape-determining protein MreC n=1 Tax=Macrococcus psychrotolerans TaxID=3039389 RepID=A0AAU6R7A1_9STAP|nr:MULTISPECIES: rod shape-determining protein MreC [Macrococcus]MDJ1111392.1 rod shape-determining protein MreC [Macrococcus sp. S115]QYA32143.1 rod shape-determining protein MreC [Macrococcus sp. 19Msa1099]QYA36948.1 rod shape-determining protein MreC [Macrococcus caseolyticus]QYA75656.1 rod shape-determining protein MreC [Macrococcus caseolyticus]